MLDELEIHLGDMVYFVEVVRVLVEDEWDKKGNPITKAAPRVWKYAKDAILLNRDDMPHFDDTESAEKWAWDWVRNYHKNN